MVSLKKQLNNNYQQMTYNTAEPAGFQDAFPKFSKNIKNLLEGLDPLRSSPEDDTEMEKVKSARQQFVGLVRIRNELCDLKSESDKINASKSEFLVTRLKSCNQKS